VSAMVGASPLTTQREEPAQCHIPYVACENCVISNISARANLDSTCVSQRLPVGVGELSARPHLHTTRRGDFGGRLRLCLVARARPVSTAGPKKASGQCGGKPEAGQRGRM
jgi:hypothetical protein